MKKAGKTNKRKTLRRRRALRAVISSCIFRSIASLGSSLIVGLFLILLARSAYRNVLILSSNDSSPDAMAAVITHDRVGLSGLSGLFG